MNAQTWKEGDRCKVRDAGGNTWHGTVRCVNQDTRVAAIQLDNGDWKLCRWSATEQAKPEPVKAQVPTYKELLVKWLEKHGVWKMAGGPV
jgi:hypothetical protein